ncbi:MAG: TRAP transporter large permease subunit [Gammaproteobacteria bacterium]|nr:TRAP transporter large permease subunit [Gammaproteobacteria bacterium]NIR84404.1 TRAP transporter large permease subunit [Gammaproteobacteria bacterium]NIR90885.1 TRAP transporter large permease subunit [Gammaproteobacteria bacterium]NIU07071.1 TRAP transporter large permease subunit [Gammaproteobacteria bacterium]NIV76200.1 TRAP transporter large permease subunit [Gammaproteobacteria bacterium]
MLEHPAVLMFPALFLLVFLGVPVAFSMISLSFLFGYWFFGDTLGQQFFSRLQDVAANYVLTAIPLFVFMGSVLERAGIAERLFYAIQLWIGRVRGGVALTAITMCGIFAASAGVVGAVETVVGMMAIPAMMRFGYKNDLIAGTICAGGSLGTIIPPTIVVVIYGSIAEESIGDLFAGIMIPGALMFVLFAGYIGLRCWLRPADGPPLPASEQAVPVWEKMQVTITALVPAVALVVAVLGSILAGIASPTEAAGVGAFGALVLTVIYGRLTWRVLFDIMERALRVNAMVMFTVLGGTMFSSIFMVNGGKELIRTFVTLFEFTPAELTAMLLAVIFVLGFVLDWVSVVLICMPIFVPILDAFQIDPIWFGVMACVVIQTSYLTPPIAPSIYYLRGIAPPEITYPDMFTGVVPFVICQLLVLLVVALYPQTALYLPELLFGF